MKKTELLEELSTIIGLFESGIKDEVLEIIPPSEKQVGAKEYFTNLNILFMEKANAASLIEIIDKHKKIAENEIELIQSENPDPEYDALFNQTIFNIEKIKKKIVDNISAMQKGLIEFNLISRRIFLDSQSLPASRR